MSPAHAMPQGFATTAEFDTWSSSQPDRWELHEGVPVATAPERLGHALIKARVWRELDRAVDQHRSSCQAIPDGLTVPGPGLRSFIPDAMVVCGETLDKDDTRIERPVIVVEVLSPSTAHVDISFKLHSYFALPSVRHYLIVSPDHHHVILHTRRDGDELLTRLLRHGAVHLDPPGIGVSIDAFYAGTNLAEPPAP